MKNVQWAALAGGLAIASAVGAQELAMRESAQFRWVCGGVGAEERAALAELRPQANLELLFVTARRGGYLAGAEVAVLPIRTIRSALVIIAEGPVCLVFAPPGRYRIAATVGDATRAVEATVGTKPGAPGRFVFSFPDEPWDGIRASDEEKRQAR